MATISQVVAENVMKAIKADDRTVSWLARKLDVESSWVRRRLTGGVEITLDQAELFAQALGTTRARLERQEPIGAEI